MDRIEVSGFGLMVEGWQYAGDGMVQVFVERTDAALGSLSEAITKVIVPLHQIASNQGFPTWRPSVEYSTVRF